VCAGAIAAAHVSFVFWTPYVLSDTLFLLLAAVALTGSGLASFDDPGWDAGIVGCLAILSIAARPTGTVLCVALVPLIVMAAHRNGRRMALLLGAFCFRSLSSWPWLPWRVPARSDLVRTVPAESPTGRVREWKMVCCG